MIEHFRLPDLGEGLPEAELVQWMVEVGDRVTLNQSIAEVETAKAVVELPSPFEGVVSALHAQAGDTILVGSVVISLDVGGADATAPQQPTAHEAESPVTEKAVPNLVGYGAAPASGRPRRRARTPAHAGRAGGVSRSDADAAVRAAAPHDVLRELRPAEPVRERPRSTPPVRKLAQDLGVDLARIEGSGDSGLVTRADVEAFASRRAAGEPASYPVVGPDPADPPRVTRIPIRGVRKLTADAMVRSAFTAPHVTTFLTVDVTASLELISSLAHDRALDGHRIGILALTAKAVCLALTAHPGLNSAWDDDAQEIVEHHYVNLGIAAATPRGLIVPNIKDADGMNLVDLADRLAQLAETARGGRTSPAEMSGGTFSISNVGVFGIDAGTPIINPGEAGILALGAVRRQPWEHAGEIALRDVMTLSLSFDHRLVDGEQGSRFLAAVGGVLREPGRAMLLG